MLGPITFSGEPIPRLAVEQTVRIEPREGMAKTIYYYSYSGGLVLAEPLPLLEMNLGETLVEIAPARLGHPSFRATPQFTNESFKRWFGAPPTFPVQMASFAAPPTDSGATINFWEGPSDDLPPNAPSPPMDTLIVTAHGAESGGLADLIEGRVLRPLWEWLRALSDQWWAGRSYERISGPLHFIAPVDGDNRVIGRPTAVASMASAGRHMMPVTAAIWTDAAERAVAGEPAAERGLATDAKYMFVTKEFRSGVILASCAFEAARDRLLAEAGVPLKSLSGSQTDLLKHLSVGFAKVFGRNIVEENENLSQRLKAFWIARGDAAHGRPILWRNGEGSLPIEMLSLSEFTEGVDDILAWLSSVAKPRNTNSSKS